MNPDLAKAIGEIERGAERQLRARRAEFEQMQSEMGNKQVIIGHIEKQEEQEIEEVTEEAQTKKEKCAVQFTFLIVGMQTSTEWRDPTRLRTSASLHGDHLKSDQLEAVNRGEGYLRETFEFRGALIH